MAIKKVKESLTIHGKSSVQEVFCSSNNGAYHRERSGTVFIFFIGFTQKLGL